MSLAAMTVRLEPSAFVPLALGFFGLGVGYLIYGPQELVGYPPRDRKVDVTTGIWGIWVPGFLQFVSGVLLFVGLSWFGSFDEKPLYMAAVAFTAYGVHWWRSGWAASSAATRARTRSCRSRSWCSRCSGRSSSLAPMTTPSAGCARGRHSAGRGSPARRARP
jgi:hypothetical protein